MGQSSKKTLGIYGAGGLGREVLELASIINERSYRWDEIIFIADSDYSGTVNGVSVYGYEKALEMFGSSLEIIVGIGEPETRERLINKIEKDKIKAPSLIHPDVYVPESTSVGDGVVIQYGCFISCNAKLEDYVYLQPQCNIGHDCVLGRGCMIAGFGNISGAVHIGKYTYLGLSVTVKENVEIGSHSIIGMASAVYKNVPDEVIAMGNPARPLKKNEERCVFKR